MSLPKNRHYPPKKPKIGCLVWSVILIVTVVALIWWSGRGMEAEKRSADYKLGHEMGFMVGKAAFYDGRERDGQRAKEMGDSTAKSNGAKNAQLYSKGFHHGYNDGYHVAESVTPKRRKD